MITNRLQLRSYYCTPLMRNISHSATVFRKGVYGFSPAADESLCLYLVNERDTLALILRGGCVLALSSPSSIKVSLKVWISQELCP